jgi:hypothetical protein
MNIHFTSSGAITIKTPQGVRLTVAGTSIEDLENHVSNLQCEIARKQRQIQMIESVISGESEQNPEALR